MAPMNELSPEHWKQVDSLLATALELPPDERAAYLTEACGGDLSLLAELAELLRSSDEAEAMLGDSVTEFAAPLLAANPLRTADDAMLGATIGHYRLLEEVGRGGMGVVYLAERADGQFTKRVALKLVKRGMDSEEILRRFRYERQILAALDHPNIARLLDGGVSDDGRPYLVMEYAEGVPIDRYCDEHRLSIDARLRLFETVCEAVGHAHRNLIVHRDLKPSNILVTGDGQVKLLDFGIAKLISDEDDPDFPETRAGHRVLTVAYAAPEQLRGQHVTTATDVYALGVVLYELLTGRRPLALEGVPPHHAERIVSSQEPERPSAAVARPIEPRRPEASAAAMPAPDAGATRSATVDRLRRRLQGDLDAILLTALRKEPERRYTSADALADDLRRHRRALPVKARPEGAAYRAHKFVSRHRMAVLAAGAFVGLLLASITLYTVRITQERNRATEAGEKALATMVFLETLFDGADPDQTLGDTLNVFDLLERGSRQLETDLAHQPDTRAAIQRTLGNLYLKLGDYERAEPLIEDALSARMALRGVPHPETAMSLHSLAGLRFKQGEYDSADSLFRLAVAAQRAVYGNAHPEVATFMNDHGYMLAYAGRFDEAEPIFRAALEMVPGTDAESRTVAATSRYGMASIRMNEAEYAEAESLYREVLETRRGLHGDLHTAVAEVLNDLGNLLYDTERYDEAEAALRDNLEIRRALLGPSHPDVSLALHNLALVPYARGDYAGADSLMQAALAIKEKLLGREHRDIGITINNIAWVRLQTGDLAGAESLFREALDIVSRSSGRVSADAGLLLGNVGFVLQKQERLAEAEPYFREALAVRRAVHGDENMLVAARLSALGSLLRDMRRFDEAEALHRESLTLRRALREPGDGDVARGLLNLGQVLVDRTRCAEAGPLLDEAATIFRATADSSNAAAASNLQESCAGTTATAAQTLPAGGAPPSQP